MPMPAFHKLHCQLASMGKCGLKRKGKAFPEIIITCKGFAFQA
jgi:hypothetical protein